MQVHFVGDSQAKRWTEYCKRYQGRLEVYSTAFSGATVRQVRDFLKESGSSIRGIPCTVFLGTNDLKTSASVYDFKKQYLSLLKVVRKTIQPSLTIVITIPQYPRYKDNQLVKSKIAAFNEFLATLNRPGSSVVLNWPTEVPRNFFTPKYHNGRVDLIHLSRLGFQYLESQVVQILSQEQLRVARRSASE